MNLAKEIGEIQKKLSLLLSMKSQVDALAGVADTVCGIERSLQEMSSKYDDVLAEMKRQSTDMSNLRKRVEKLETQTNNSEVEMLKQEVNNLDQYSRRLNLEIHGLGEQTNEKVIEKLNLLADELELPKLSGKDIEAAHRLRTRAGTDGGDKPSPIIGVGALSGFLCLYADPLGKLCTRCNRVLGHRPVVSFAKVQNVPNKDFEIRTKQLGPSMEALFGTAFACLRPSKHLCEARFEDGPRVWHIHVGRYVPHTTGRRVCAQKQMHSASGHRPVWTQDGRLVNSCYSGQRWPCVSCTSLPKDYRLILPPLPSGEGLKRTLVLHCDIAARPYGINYLRKPLKELGIIQEVSGIRAYQMSHVSLLNMKTDEAKKTLLDAGLLSVKDRPCVVIDPERQDVHFKLHWVAFDVYAETVRRAFREYGEVKEVISDKWRDEDFEGVESTTRFVRLLLKEGVTTDRIPHQMRLGSGTALVVVPGKAPLCLRCRNTGHFRRDCRVPRCAGCRAFGHEQADYTRSYASAASRASNADHTELLMNEEEAERAAALKAGVEASHAVATSERELNGGGKKHLFQKKSTRECRRGPSAC
ncbi:hypothetical protein HPB51_025503 [Rhipicephalus microplus]|uniref:CCHC-type domain-containing protein n=1 Tax=Rhipicephalus microplus TaxID=6941 RepID=A0A9J6E5M1_RHIMP|nr:hypothetical protein HPB51_025503 [Rhipicephalus microplus]